MGMTTHRSTMTPEQAKPHATALLINLGEAIGDKAAIQAAITQAVDKHPHDWPLVLASALAYTFAEHTRLDPDAPARKAAA
jgi:hypothetical protein